MPDEDESEVETEEEYTSGPFCEHYSQFGECDEMCVCMHKCRRHDADGECDDCPCKKFEEPR